MIQRLLGMMGWNTLTPTLGANLSAQATARAQWDYLGAAVNNPLQERLRAEKDLAEERRQAPKKRTTLLDGLAVSLITHKRDTGEQPRRSPWQRRRRQRPPH